MISVLKPEPRTGSRSGRAEVVKARYGTEGLPRFSAWSVGPTAPAEGGGGAFGKFPPSAGNYQKRFWREPCRLPRP